MVKPGDVVYLWCHAYLRLIGRVEAVHGSRRVSLSDASKVLDDEGDGKFFSKGVTQSTRYAYLGDVPDVVYLCAVAFDHPLPARRTN